MDLKGRTAVVTGGGQGIGKAVARRFLAAGMKVILLELDVEAGRETENELRGTGDIHFIKADVSKEKEVRGAMARTVKVFGGIDVLVNNAGIFIEEKKAITELPVAQWDRVIAVNLTSVFLCSKYALPGLKKSRGSIVNIASTRNRIPKRTPLPKEVSTPLPTRSP